MIALTQQTVNLCRTSLKSSMETLSSFSDSSKILTNQPNSVGCKEPLLKWVGYRAMPLLGILYNIHLNTMDKGINSDKGKYPVFVGKKNLTLVTDEVLRGCITLLKLKDCYDYWEKEHIAENGPILKFDIEYLQEF